MAKDIAYREEPRNAVRRADDGGGGAEIPEKKQAAGRPIAGLGDAMESIVDTPGIGRPGELAETLLCLQLFTRFPRNCLTRPGIPGHPGARVGRKEEGLARPSPVQRAVRSL